MRFERGAEDEELIDVEMEEEVEEGEETEEDVAEGISD